MLGVMGDNYVLSFSVIFTPLRSVYCYCYTKLAVLLVFVTHLCVYVAASTSAS